MSIEDEIFIKSKTDINKLKNYGFKKLKNDYIFEKSFMDGDFKAVIKADKNGNIKGKIFDNDNNEEYMPANLKYGKTSYANIVKDNYISILNDIKNNCCSTKYFIYDQTNRISDNIYSKYKELPDFPWGEDDTNCVFRNKDTSKWYGVVMQIDINKLDKNKNDRVEIINIKLDKDEIQNLLNNDGFYSAYHMNKKNWISIVLNETLPDKLIMELVDKSRKFTIK